MAAAPIRPAEPDPILLLLPAGKNRRTDVGQVVGFVISAVTRCCSFSPSLPFRLSRIQIRRDRGVLALFRLACPSLLLHYILTVLMCCRVRACRPCIVVSIHVCFCMKWCARACGVSRKYKQEAAAGRSPSRVRPVRAGAAVQCTCKAVPRCCCSLPVPGRSAGVALSTPPRMEWNAAHASRARVSCIFIGMAKFLRWCIHICMCVYYIFTAVRRPRRRWRIGRVRVAASVRFGVA